ncbi:hypothetical protein [Psychrilyobacter atlanticus]|uniref:hypothetical protein n=1 Tax=Psychrilyobacter atlanticus TaxID=271091 RepID=UPI0003F8F8D3|nr:hypothetical protein [Psychrilyobacter atlanticus]
MNIEEYFTLLLFVLIVMVVLIVLESIFSFIEEKIDLGPYEFYIKSFVLLWILLSIYFFLFN